MTQHAPVVAPGGGEASSRPSAEGTRSAARWAPTVILATLGIVVVTLASLALVPATFVTTDPTRGTDPGWVRIPTPEQSTVRIRQEASGTTNLALRLSPSEVFDESLIERSRGFRFDEANQAWVADGPASMILSGTFADLTVTLNGGTTAPDVTVRRISPGGKSLRVTVPAPDGGADTSEVIPSSAADFAATRSLATAVPRADDMSSSPGTTVRVGGVEVGAAELAEGGARALLIAGITAVAGAGWTVTLAVAVLAFGWLLGRALDVRGRRVGPVPDTIRLVGGFALLALGVNTLSYLLPASTATGLVAVTAVVIIVVRWVRDRPTGTGRSALLLLRTSFWTIPAALVAFWPLALWGERFVGRYKTDLFEYGTLAGIVRDHSLFAMQTLPIAQSSGTLTSGAGISWRSIDSVTAAALSLLPGVTVIGAFTLLGLLLFILWSMATVSLATLAGGGRGHRAVVALALFSPLFVGLYVESYFSQYYFLAFIPALVLALAWAIREPGSGLLRWPEVAAASIAAVMVAVYPYFSVIVFVGVGGALLLTSDRRRFLLRRGPILLAEVVVLVNLALLTVLNYGSTAVYQDGLNAIARNFLIGPFSGEELVGVGLGLVPYQWRDGTVEPAGWMGTVGQAVWRLGADGVLTQLIAAGAVAIALLGFLLALRWRATFSSFTFATTVAVMGLYGVFTAYLALSDDIYAALKAGWTALALVPLVAATAVFRPRMAPVLAVLLLPLSLIWLRTDVLDRAGYLVARDAPTAAAIGGHETVEPEIDAVRRSLAGAPAVAILTGPQPLAGSDRDRVARAQALIAAREAGAECTGCGEPFDTVESGLDTFTGSEACADRTVPVIIVVGVSGRQEVCGLPLEYGGSLIEVFR